MAEVVAASVARVTQCPVPRARPGAASRAVVQGDGDGEL